MNFFDYIRDWFIWLTQLAVNWAMVALTWPWPFSDLAYFFIDFSDFTARVAGYLWDASNWYNDVTVKLANTLSLDNVLAYLKTYLDAAINAWNWVSNAWNNVTGIIDTWWTSTMGEVQDLITIATQGFNDLKVAWDNFWSITWPQWTGKLDYLGAAWDNFWAVTFPTLVSFTWLDTWWNSRLADISALIDSAFTIREPFWSGWQDIRDKVFEFFTDPLEWLWSRFTNWFLGPEK